MPAAYLPTPGSAVWHLGVLPVRTYALCMVAGVLAGLWLTARRYRKAGYRPRVILDMATIAVPVGLVGARIYSLLTNSDRYFGVGRDWTDALRVWDGGMGVAGAVAAGALAAWVYCRRTGIEIGPVALAAVPALAVAQAISVWGNWFSQELYGRPSGLPWAVDISPQHRVGGFQAFATFQPLFLYESLFDILIAVGLALAIRRYVLSGGQAFALYAALWAVGSAAIESLRIDYSARMFGLRTNMIAMAVVFILACSYLYALRQRRLVRVAIQRAEPSTTQRALRPRSSRATSGNIGVASADDQPDTAPGQLPGTRL
ncbi:MAG TPA: prolipoprotein diacylglyceryl transferase family protein [Streptosporangiaceae bacterium]|nr:prolipoprotein diacylglyceryl transferase family protein [Streptosporangiaceae bacterium]